MLLRRYYRISTYCSTRIGGGFTLLESLVVVLLIGILVAIATPSWLGLMNGMNLNIATDEIHQAIQTAKHSARLNRSGWEFNIRQTANEEVQWAIYPSRTDKTVPNALVWRNLDPRIQLDLETTLAEVKGVRRVQFNHLGAVNGQLGRVALSIKGGGKSKRCVIVSTLLGALRLGHDRPKPIDGKYCR
ncbi:MAG: prepilin-type N-terminal cleavage/methylation domain-containing protein [Leptolyngbyaceae cyanobacterium bins.302]|nr:prepilin-type N-terminal cleavage/methylation domain-containing protein [Leptolyngbyaceae cyanobacterium bins.302]